MNAPDRWTFDDAAAHLFYLMTSDSYSRYLRSAHYKDFLEGARKKGSARGGFAGFKSKLNSGNAVASSGSGATTTAANSNSAANG